jgi:hypothetical protein
MRTILALTAASGIALASMVAVAPAASAKDGDVKMRQSCTGGDSFSVVKVRERKGGLRTDFWVKNNAAGRDWSFTLAQGAPTEVIAKAAKTTRASDDNPSSRDDTRHTAEVKFRTYVPDTTRPLYFTATGPGGEICAVTVTR